MSWWPTLEAAKKQAEVNAETFAAPFYVYAGLLNRGYDVARQRRQSDEPLHTANPQHPSEALVFPAVHLNGTSGWDLLRQIRAAIDALGEARKAIAAAAPHARDYCVLGDNAAERAIDQAVARATKIESVIVEYEEIYANVYEQVAAIVERRR